MVLGVNVPLGAGVGWHIHFWDGVLGCLARYSREDENG